MHYEQLAECVMSNWPTIRRSRICRRQASALSSTSVHVAQRAWAFTALHFVRPTLPSLSAAPFLRVPVSSVSLRLLRALGLWSLLLRGGLLLLVGFGKVYESLLHINPLTILKLSN